MRQGTITLHTKLINTQTHWVVTLVIQSTYLLNLTLKASLWVLAFYTKDMNFPLVNGNIDIKEEMISPKSMAYTGYTRMGMMNPTMYILALKFN